ncbi:MAG: hypothetical protein AAB036_02920 [Elusimicrobiota bacterium]
MVDDGTWNRLSSEEQREYQALRPRFIQAVLDSGLLDEWGRKFLVKSDGDFSFLSDGGPPFAAIKSKSAAVIAALHSDAVQNCNR